MLKKRCIIETYETFPANKVFAYGLVRDYLEGKGAQHQNFCDIATDGNIATIDFEGGGLYSVAMMSDYQEGVVITIEYPSDEGNEWPTRRKMRHDLEYEMKRFLAGGYE